MKRRPNSILIQIEIIRPEGYEDVHPNIVFDDMLESGDFKSFAPLVFEDDES